MKVLHLISSSGMYGAETVIINLMRALTEAGHTCALGVFKNVGNANSQLYDSVVSEGFEAHLIPCASQIDFSTATAIRALALATHADVIHAHGYKADVYCYFAFRRKPTTLVSTCHNWIDSDRIVTLYGKIDRFVLSRFTSVVAVSEGVRQRLVGAGVESSRIHMIRNGVDPRPFTAAYPSLRDGLPQTTLLIGLIGRLAPEKGIDIYLDAASQVLSRFPSAKFVVVGEGPDRAALEAKRDQLGLGSAFAFLGRRDDMPSVYASLDLLVSASRQEGLPIALLEGMASGLPICATAVGEVPTVVRAGRTGLVVQPGDTAGLASAILTLLQDPKRRAEFSSAARELIATEYSADRMATDYLTVYKQALAAKSSGSGQSKASQTITTPQSRPRIFMMDLWATLPYYTVYLSRALLQQGANLTVGSITYYLDPGCYKSRGIRLQPGLLNIVGRFNLRRLPRRILKLFESLLNLSALTVRFLFRPPDVVHVQFLPMLTARLPVDLWFIRFCRIRGSRVVLTVHDLLPHDTGEAHKAVFLALYARVDGLICHSSWVRDRLVAEFAVPAKKVSVIPHGPFFYDLPPVDKEQTLRAFNVPANELAVLWQGIIFPYKGIDLLLDAWQQVEACTSGSRLVIAGTGQPAILDQIRNQVACLGLHRVELHFRFISNEELVSLYRAASIVAYPYRAITTSGALATGLALGKTIVATDLPVFRELLADRENALLVPAPNPLAESDAQSEKDSACVTALASALIELVQDAGLRNQLSASVRAMNFGDESWRAIASQTLETYQSVLSN